MMTKGHVEYWPVGTAHSRKWLFSTEDFEANLLADWVPSVPYHPSMPLMGWPRYLLDTTRKAGVSYLILKKRAGRAERQWKTFMSWMNGVVGARKFADRDGYYWIAPLSAFYPAADTEVAIGPWPSKFPSGDLEISGDTAKDCNLRPDYIALRPKRDGKSYGYDWALVEAKGTRNSLKSKNAPRKDWRCQCRNAVVCFKGQRLHPDRHLIVATRSNPNAERPYTRRLQIRAWNSESTTETELPAGFVSVIVASHLFGLCRNLGLVNNAAAIAQSAQVRRADQSGKEYSGQLARLNENADEEMDQLRQEGSEESLDDYLNVRPRRLFPLRRSLYPLRVDLRRPTVRLIEELRRARNIESAFSSIREAERSIQDARAIEEEQGLVDQPGRLLAGLRVQG